MITESDLKIGFVSIAKRKSKLKKRKPVVQCKKITFVKQLQENAAYTFTYRSKEPDGTSTQQYQTETADSPAVLQYIHITRKNK